MKKIFTISIIIEVLIILGVLFYIYNKLNKGTGTLGVYSIKPQKKTNLVFPEIDEAEYFYEFQPNSSFAEEAPWLPNGVGGTYSINSDGLNARQDYSIEKPRDTYRIIALGDSFTNGDYVNTNENYPSKLEDLLNSKLKCTNIKKFEILNFGVGGYDIEYSVLRYKLRGRKYNADMVLWYMFNNDFLAVNEIRTPMALKYNQELTDSGVKDVIYVNGKFFPSWIKAEKDMYEKYPAAELIGREYTYLSEFGKFFNGKIVIFSDSNLPKSYTSIIKTFAAARGNTEFFNGIKQYSKLPDGHPTADSYTYISDILYNYLTSNNIIPCQKEN